MVKVELSRAETEAARVYLFAFKTLEALAASEADLKGVSNDTPLEPHLYPDCKRELERIRRR
jgi:hypothetical protein